MTWQSTGSLLRSLRPAAPENAAANPEEHGKKPRQAAGWLATDGVLLGGSYRDRTDDIHGVNVALYQLS